MKFHFFLLCSFLICCAFQSCVEKPNLSNSDIRPEPWNAWFPKVQRYLEATDRYIENAAGILRQLNQKPVLVQIKDGFQQLDRIDKEVRKIHAPREFAVYHQLVVRHLHHLKIAFQSMLRLDPGTFILNLQSAADKTRQYLSIIQQLGKAHGAPGAFVDQVTEKMAAIAETVARLPSMELIAPDANGKFIIEVTGPRFPGGFDSGASLARAISYSYQPPRGWKRLQQVTKGSVSPGKYLLDLTAMPQFKPQADRVAIIRFEEMSGSLVQSGLMDMLGQGLISQEPKPRVFNEMKIKHGNIYIQQSTEEDTMGFGFWRKQMDVTIPGAVFRVIFIGTAEDFRDYERKVVKSLFSLQKAPAPAEAN